MKTEIGVPVMMTAEAFRKSAELLRKHARPTIQMPCACCGKTVACYMLAARPEITRKDLELLGVDTVTCLDCLT